jgi:hypothetical protein
VVEGAPESVPHCRCRKMTALKCLAYDVNADGQAFGRRIASTLRNVEARAPSTTLLRRVVPLPRYRGGG